MRGLGQPTVRRTAQFRKFTQSKLLLYNKRRLYALLSYLGDKFHIAISEHSLQDFVTGNNFTSHVNDDPRLCFLVGHHVDDPSECGSVRGLDSANSELDRECVALCMWVIIREDKRL